MFEESFVNVSGFQEEKAKKFKWRVTNGDRHGNFWHHQRFSESQIVSENAKSRENNRTKLCNSLQTVSGKPSEKFVRQNFFLLPVFKSTTEKQKTTEKETKNPKHVETQSKLNPKYLKAVYCLSFSTCFSTQNQVEVLSVRIERAKYCLRIKSFQCQGWLRTKSIWVCFEENSQSSKSLCFMIKAKLLKHVDYDLKNNKNPGKFIGKSSNHNAFKNTKENVFSLFMEILNED